MKILTLLFVLITNNYSVTVAAKNLKNHLNYQGIYKLNDPQFTGNGTIIFNGEYLQYKQKLLNLTLKPLNKKNCFSIVNRPKESLCFFKSNNEFSHFEWHVSGGDTVIGNRQYTQLVKKISDLLLEHYIEEKSTNKIINQIEKSNAINPYSQEIDLDVLAKRLTADLRIVNNDYHLYARNKNSKSPHKSPTKKKRRMVRIPQTTGSSSGKRGGKVIENSIFANSTYETEILDGNIGYLPINIFGMGEDNMEKIEAAMHKMKDTDQLIIDLTKAPGGAGEAVIKLSSYFFNINTHLVNSQRTKKEAVQGRWTDTELVDYFYDKPVIILTSKKTGSASESFLFGLKNQQRVLQIGESTGGGGYNNQFFDLSPDLAVSISIGVTSNPTTGIGWQTTGIHPDVSIKADQALVKALELIRSGETN